MGLQDRLVSKLSSRIFTTEERKVKKETRSVVETKVVDTNEAFTFLQECITWVTNKLVSFNLLTLNLCRCSVLYNAVLLY